MPVRSAKCEACDARNGIDAYSPGDCHIYQLSRCVSSSVKNSACLDGPVMAWLSQGKQGRTGGKPRSMELMNRTEKNDDDASSNAFFPVGSCSLGRPSVWLVPDRWLVLRLCEQQSVASLHTSGGTLGFLRFFLQFGYLANRSVVQGRNARDGRYRLRLEAARSKSGYWLACEVHGVFSAFGIRKRSPGAGRWGNRCWAC